MPVLVSDTSVLIDLERGLFLEPVFRLPFKFAVPDLLYERELKDHGGPDTEMNREGDARKATSFPQESASNLSTATSWFLSDS